jgi:hypothetical protein
VLVVGCGGAVYMGCMAGVHRACWAVLAGDIVGVRGKDACRVVFTVGVGVDLGVVGAEIGAGIGAGSKLCGDRA